jgi:hypothetical protein
VAGVDPPVRGVGWLPVRSLVVGRVVVDGRGDGRVRPAPAGRGEEATVNEQPDEDRMRYRVAVVVFADVKGTDYGDAASGAAMAVRAAVSGQRMALPNDLPCPIADQTRFEGLDMSTRVVAVMDLGMAAGNGYLWTEPTRKAWSNYGEDRPDVARRTWTVEEP